MVLCYNRNMNKSIILACLLVSSPLLAASNPESARSAAGIDFSSLGSFAPIRTVRADSLPAVPSKPAGKIAVKTASVQTVSVSGNLNMNGNGNVMRGSAFVMVNFSGYATLTDGTGRITSNSTWFNRSVNCNVSGGWVRCNDWPTWYVDFYKDGRHVGNGSVSGTLNASAYAPNGFVNLTAYTNLSGSVTVTEP